MYRNLKLTDNPKLLTRPQLLFTQTLDLLKVRPTPSVKPILYFICRCRSLHPITYSKGPDGIECLSMTRSPDTCLLPYGTHLRG